MSNELEDPYLWLENIESPDSMDWVDKRNEHCRGVLESDPRYPEVFNRTLKQLDSPESMPYVKGHGLFLYNLWKDTGHKRGLLRRTTLGEFRKENTAWETVLDLDALAAAEHENWFFGSIEFLKPRCELALIALSRGGGDAVVVREFDVMKKAFTAGGFELSEAKCRFSWRDENSIYVGTDFGPGSLTKSGYPRQVRLWRRGTSVDTATILFEAAEDSVFAFGQRFFSGGDSLDIIQEATDFFSAVYHIRDGEKWVCVPIPHDAVISSFYRGLLLIELRSDWEHAGQRFSQGAVISAAAADILGGTARFETVLAPGMTSTVTDIFSTKSAIVVSLLDNVCGRLIRLRSDGAGHWKSENLSFPPDGELSVVDSGDDSDDILVAYSSFLSPATLYRFDATEGKIETLKSLPAFFNADNLVSEQRFAVSLDGTKIPYFLVHRKDMACDGENPTLLFGYGGFEISKTPGYNADVGMNWLEQGGVYALSNIRGGGEYGPRWHLAALKENRHKAYEDFIAIAQDLIDKKITSPEKLGIQGRSNGGLLMGVMLTSRPELWSAIICQAPLMDMRRYSKLLAGASWTAEFGDPDDPGVWDYMAKYSPYHNVKAGVRYPRIFFSTSTKDDRVHPGHVRKMAARMLEQGHELLYFENIDGGHAGAANNSQIARVSALNTIYLYQQLID